MPCACDDLGRCTSITRANGATTTYAWNPVSRLTGLTQNLAGTANDLTLGFSHNPAGQIVGRTRSNPAYAYVDSTDGQVDYTIDG